LWLEWQREELHEAFTIVTGQRLALLTARDESEWRSADNLRNAVWRAITDSDFFLCESNSSMPQVVSPRNKSDQRRGTERG
jgi:hypothetical protein